MSNQDINTEFSSFIKTYSKENPSKRLSDIATRRNIDLNKLDSSALDNPDADYKSKRIWENALADLKQLIDPMPNTLWNLAFKYFSDIFMGGESDEEKKEAISDELGLPENRIDAENELAERVKEKICETSYVINGTELTLTSQEDAQNKTPEELCQDIESRISEMGELIDQDRADHAVYNEVQTNHTFEDFFKALAAFLDSKVGAVLKKKGMPTYKFAFKEEDGAVFVTGTHIGTGLEVIKVSPNINDEDDTGSIDDLLCDITVAGLGIADLSDPLHQDVNDMSQVLDYITRHRKYAPGDDGEYDISGVKGSEVPALVYNAVQDWQATTTACRTVNNARNDAYERLGKDGMMELDNQVKLNSWYRDLGNSNGYSTKFPEAYKNKDNQFNERVKVAEPKVDKNRNFTEDDISDVLNKLQIKLNGKTEDGQLFSPDELAALDDLPDDTPSNGDDTDDRV